jgi:Flp pilus assembly protein TadD
VRSLLAFVLMTGASLTSTGVVLAESAVHYRELGISYRDQGRLSEAIATFQKAVDLEPENLAGRVNLGWTLHLAGQDRAAADVLEQTIHIDPFHAPTFNALGIIYLMNDDLAAAVLAHNWAVLIAPDNEIAHYNLSLAYHRLQQYDWAIASAQTAFDLEPDNPHPLVALAIAQWDGGQQAIAQQTYQQAIDLDARYRNKTFLTYLNQSGFSTDQIAIAQQILDSKK